MAGNQRPWHQGRPGPPMDRRYDHASAPYSRDTGRPPRDLFADRSHFAREGRPPPLDFRDQQNTDWRNARERKEHRYSPPPDQRGHFSRRSSDASYAPGRRRSPSPPYYAPARPSPRDEYPESYRSPNARFPPRRPSPFQQRRPEPIRNNSRGSYDAGPAAERERLDREREARDYKAAVHRAQIHNNHHGTEPRARSVSLKDNHSTGEVPPQHKRRESEPVSKTQQPESRREEHKEVAADAQNPVLERAVVNPPSAPANNEAEVEVMEAPPVLQSESPEAASDYINPFDQDDTSSPAESRSIAETPTVVNTTAAAKDDAVEASSRSPSPTFNATQDVSSPRPESEASTVHLPDDQIIRTSGPDAQTDNSQTMEQMEVFSIASDMDDLRSSSRPSSPKVSVNVNLAPSGKLIDVESKMPDSDDTIYEEQDPQAQTRSSSPVLSTVNAEVIEKPRTDSIVPGKRHHESQATVINETVEVAISEIMDTVMATVEPQFERPTTSAVLVSAVPARILDEPITRENSVVTDSEMMEGTDSAVMSDTESPAQPSHHDDRDASGFDSRFEAVMRVLPDMQFENPFNPTLTADISKSNRETAKKAHRFDRRRCVHHHVEFPVSRATAERFAVRRMEFVDFLKKKIKLIAQEEVYLQREYQQGMKKWQAHAAECDASKLQELEAEEAEALLAASALAPTRGTRGKPVGFDVNEAMHGVELPNSVLNEAEIPALIHRPFERELFGYEDINCLVDDPLEYYYITKEDPRNTWTEDEQAIFSARYKLTPKQFGVVAAGLPGRTHQDCVLHYYRTKKELDYRASGKPKVRTAARSSKGRTRKVATSASTTTSTKTTRRSLLATVTTMEDEDSGEESAEASRALRKRRAINDVDDAKRKRNSLRKPVRPTDSPAREAVSEARAPPLSQTPPLPAPQIHGPVASPAIGSARWSNVDEVNFVNLLKSFGTDYSAIASHMPGKTIDQITRHFDEYLIERNYRQYLPRLGAPPDRRSNLPPLPGTSSFHSSNMQHRPPTQPSQYHQYQNYGQSQNQREYSAPYNRPNHLPPLSNASQHLPPTGQFANNYDYRNPPNSRNFDNRYERNSFQDRPRPPRGSIDSMLNSGERVQLPNPMGRFNNNNNGYFPPNGPQNQSQSHSAPYHGSSQQHSQGYNNQYSGNNYRAPFNQPYYR